MRWNYDPPYSLRDEHGKITGFYIDLVQEVLTKMNCKAKFVELPWARALAELEAGRLDILPGTLQTAERHRFAEFSEPINHSPNVLFMKKTAISKFNVKHLNDILSMNFRLGIQVNVAYGAEFDKLMKKPAFLKKLTPLYQRNSGWKMANIDRIDGLIADEATGLMELKALGLEQIIVKTTISLSSGPSLVAFSKQSISKDFVQQFNQQLQTLIRNRDFERIRERHIPCAISQQTLGCK
ncbi:substrate-binding periplasmic protein [Undibacterium fentianense]|uniref:Transporter substrate-binding domain-containing protein n=1 Tax=Undibacterium fentianense TaxID=2828728 RepID=A0A941ID77_9BURK|nr:transporter substrate-binding domain-containing protein [Undibacterium fentianense]MBR7799668.1 transporter substrate-binding domain-containing protein [Undibacterium fentianense]